MLHGTALATVVAFGLSLSLASPLSKRAALEDCLSSSGVSVDSQGSDDWSLDVAPFNLRLNFTPVAIAVPTTVKQIQDAVACAVKLGVKANPKCGGHSYGSFGLGGEDGHLTIELDRMSKVTLDNKTGIATIEGGSRLGHVAAELYAQGKRAFSHGTCPGVGVAGHTLHGGFGLSSHTKGLALDALVSAKVVLANSTVVSCSATENPDVFWALRGAGGSMGVVAEFQFQTFAVPEQVTIFVASAPWKQDKAAAGLKAFQDYVANTMPAELNMRLFLNRIYANFEGLYYGDKAGLVAALQPFLNATNGTLQYTQTGTWLDQVKHFGNGVALNQTHPYDMHETFYSSSLYSQALTDQQLAAFVDYWFGAGKKQTRNWWIQVDAHGGKNSAIPKVPGNSTSYAHRDYLFLYQFYDRVNFGAYPADGFPFLQSFIGNLTGTMKDGEWGRYVNYPDTQLDQATAQKNYWGGHLAKLQAIKAQLDPNDVFHYPQGILPAASA